MTDADRLLAKLRAAHGQWVENLYGTTGCMVHSRIAELRKRGHRIECKRFGQGDYRYRLVESPPTPFVGVEGVVKITGRVRRGRYVETHEVFDD